MTTAAVICATLAAACFAASGPGTRFGLFDFRIGLLLFTLGGLFGLLALILGAIAHTRSSILAAIVGLAAMLFPAYGLYKARGVPPIHDITTDVNDPPRFEAVLLARGGTSNPIRTPMNADVVRQQRAAYADLQPLLVPLAPDAAFTRAVEVARAQGWEIVKEDRTNRTLEATAMTSFFGFKDDVAVRVRPEGSGSRIDVRSTSRVGRSDAGANAARIRKYLGEMR